MPNPIFTTRLIRILTTAAVMGLAFMLLEGMRAGRSISVNTVVAQDEGPKPAYQGLRSCVPCHNEDLTKPSLLAALTPEFSALNEIETFSHDKHRQAYELLSGKLGLEMQEILSKARGDAEYKVTTDKQCLACHANWHWKEGFDKPPLFELGVTCESCHGPSSLWEGPHDAPAWRKTTPKEKEDKFGFVDVRNPIRRAKQCFSCHIGNVKEGKVVTHEMYAAGHPPLPGIEIETFASQMQSHWRFLQEKGEFQFRDEYVKANFPGVEHDPLTDLPRTKSVMIGGVIALRESLNLFASQAVEENGEAWPELAVFDCAACHHDLSSPSWRQNRGYARSVPGRPQMLSWPTALVKLGIRQRAGDDDSAFQTELRGFTEKLNALHDVLNRRPFGAPQKIAEVVQGENGLIAELDELADELFRSSVQEADAKRALLTLATLTEEDYPDYHSARQLVWAIRTIQSELQAGPYPEFTPKPQDETEKQSIDRAIGNLKLFREWQAGPQATAVKAVDARLAGFDGLDARLRLKLPAGVDYVVAEQLPESLRAAADYDPVWFRAQLQRLAATLSE